MLKLKPYQTTAVDELLSKSFKLLKLGDNKSLVFKAPTGAGKTVMSAEWLKQFMEQIDEAPIPQKQYAFIWIAPQKLHTQSLLSFSSFFEENKTLRCLEFNDITNKSLANGDILFLNWASINKDNNLYIRENEQDNNLPAILENTRQYGITPIVIIDEAHFGAGAAARRATEFLRMVNAPLKVEVSATPDFDGDEMVTVHRQDVIQDQMIKKGIKLNSGLKPKNNLNLNQYLLDEALKQQKKMRKEFTAHNSSVKPLLLIQLPSDAVKESSLDKSIREDLEPFLETKGITTQNGKLAVWLSEEKTPNLDDIEKNESIVEVMIFKQAVALGWDCPRASVLAIYRDTKSEKFGIQTVGRILRMPEQKHYGSEVIDYAHVYTNLESNYIEFVNEDAQYFNQILAKRQANVPSITLSKEYLDQRTNRLRLRSTILIKAFRESATLEGLKTFESSPNFLEENSRHWGVKFHLNPKEIQVTIPKDIILGANDIEINKQNIIADDKKLKYAKTLTELELIARKFVKTLCGSYEKVEGGSILLQKLIEFLEEYFGITELDALKVIAYVGNHRAWDEFISNTVLPEYEKISKLHRLKNPPTKQINDWDWPFERSYNTDVFEPQDNKYHTLEPFCGEIQMSTPEKRFIEFLGQNSNCIKYWYKNGDNGKDHFSVAYKNRHGEDKLFFIDFIILLNDGTIALFDTKSKDSDENMAYKHNALVDYMAEKNEQGEKLIGGILIEERESWRYSAHKLDVNQRTNLDGWQFFKPCDFGSKQESLSESMATTLDELNYQITITQSNFDSFRTNLLSNDREIITKVRMYTDSKLRYSQKSQGTWSKWDNVSTKGLKQIIAIFKNIQALKSTVQVENYISSQFSSTFITEHSGISIEIEASTDKNFKNNVKVLGNIYSQCEHANDNTELEKLLELHGISNNDDWNS